MAEYTVYYRATSDLTVHVDAEDYDSAIDCAEEVRPSDELCAHCSGWHQKWTREPGQFEPYEVVDADGHVVWSARPARRP